MGYIGKIPFAKEGLVLLTLMAFPLLSGCSKIQNWSYDVQGKMHQKRVRNIEECMNNSEGSECDLLKIRGEQGGGADGNDGGVGGGTGGGSGGK